MKETVAQIKAIVTEDTEKDINSKVLPVSGKIVNTIMMRKLQIIQQFKIELGVFRLPW